MVLAVCINDKGKPNEIPASKWIKKDRVYEVDWIGVLNNGQYNVHLKEPVLDQESCFPYTGFSVNRFRFNKKSDDQVSSELIDELIGDIGVRKDGGPTN